MDQTLDEFRNQWKNELNGRKSQNDEAEGAETSEIATNLFLNAVELERNGKVFDALRLYRRAVQLDPNIEYKIYQSSKQQQPSVSHRSSKKHDPQPEASPIELDDLIDSFSKDLSLSNHPICQPNFTAGTIRTERHFSSLPIEVIIHILKFVVSKDLDMQSLERFGQVCKGFFLLSRENELWHKASKIVWKNNLSPPQPPLMTWRDIFINRCRVNFNGCYISKITYQRLGENSFQDYFYRPVQIVEYFRLIRFFPNGDLLMMTSADELQSSVNKLKSKRAATLSNEVLKGSYHYQGDHVLIVIKKQGNAIKNTRRKTFESDDLITFFVELEIVSSKKKFSKLVWKNYSISHLRKNEEMSSELDTRSTTKYPPFFFSHVKSYNTQCDECLQ